MNFHLSFKNCSMLTPDVRKQPQTSLDSIKKANKGSTKYGHLDGAMYIILSIYIYGIFFGGIPKC